MVRAVDAGDDGPLHGTRQRDDHARQRRFAGALEAIVVRVDIDVPGDRVERRGRRFAKVVVAGVDSALQRQIDEAIVLHLPQGRLPLSLDTVQIAGRLRRVNRVDSVRQVVELIGTVGGA